MSFVCFKNSGTVFILLFNPVFSVVHHQVSGAGNFQTFSFGSRLNFELFVQYKEYIGFAKCMDALKGRKIVMKESDGKALAATIKVTLN